MRTPSKPEFSWEKEAETEVDAYAIHDKGEDVSRIRKLLKQKSMQDIVLLTEIFTRPYP